MCASCEKLTNAGQYRHRWEMPLTTLAWILSICAVVVSVYVTLNPSVVEITEDNAWLYQMGYGVLLLPIPMAVLRFFLAAKSRANGARVGPTQFPEIWAIYEDLLAKFDLPATPALYVVNGNGVVNAYALSCSMQRKYIVLHAEIAMLVKVNPDIVRFVLAHELAHHKLGHTSLLRLAITTVMRSLYLPGQAFIRAQEYSADRLAMAACPESAETLVFLTVGPFMAEGINTQAFLEQADAEEKSWMVRIVNIASDHAVMTKRFKALIDIARHGFGRHGQMF